MTDDNESIEDISEDITERKPTLKDKLTSTLSGIGRGIGETAEKGRKTYSSHQRRSREISSERRLNQIAELERKKAEEEEKTHAYELGQEVKAEKEKRPSLVRSVANKAHVVAYNAISGAISSATTPTSVQRTAPRATKPHYQPRGRGVMVADFFGSPQHSQARPRQEINFFGSSSMGGGFGKSNGTKKSNIQFFGSSKSKGKKQKEIRWF